MKKNYIDSSVIELSTIYLGKERGSGGTIVEVFRPLDYGTINNVSPTKKIYLEGTTNNLTITFNAVAGSYPIAKIELMSGDSAVKTINNPTTTSNNFPLTGISSAVTYGIKVTDTQGYAMTYNNQVTISFGKKIYWGIIPNTAHDILEQSDIDMVTTTWVKNNCESVIQTNKTITKEFALEVLHGFAVIAVPKAWTNCNPDMMTIDVLNQMMVNTGCYRKTIEIDSVDYDIYIATDRSKYNLRYGIK